MVARDQLSGFIRASFRSVWALELLLLLKREQRPWGHDEIVAALRASSLVVTQSVASLAAAGLVIEDDAGHVLYTPVSAETEALVVETERLYASKPDAVRRLIVAASAGGLSAFADAFRIRKD